MNPAQKLSVMIKKYFEAEEKFGCTESEHWLKAKKKLKKDILSEISSSRESELDSKQLKLQF